MRYAGIKIFNVTQRHSSSDPSPARNREIMDFPSTSGLSWRLGLILALVAGMSKPSTAGYSITDLGVLTPSGTSAGLAINSSGQVAGSATLANGTSVAVKTSGAGQFQLVGGSLGVSSVADSINVSGSVAGTYTDSNGIRHAFSVANGNSSTINPLAGGTYTLGNGINKSGQVVGTGDTASGTTRAFIAGSAGTPTAINPLGTGTFSQGNGINDNGTVVGSSETSPGGLVHAFLSSSGGPAVDLLTRNSAGNFVFDSYGMAIANNGDVTGYGDVGRFEHAFYAPSSGGPLVDLGVLPGGSSSFGYGLNDLGEVVGAVSFGVVQPGQASSEAFIWSAITGMLNLNSLLSTSDQANWVLTSAAGINDNDQITGVGLLNGVPHGFLLTPNSTVPEPTAGALAVVGLAIVAAWSRIKRGQTAGQEAS